MKTAAILVFAIRLSVCPASGVENNPNGAGFQGSVQAGLPIADGRSADYILSGRDVLGSSNEPKIWALLDFYANGDLTKPIVFDGTDAIYSESVTPAERPRPAYIRLSRSGAILTFTLCDQAGTRLASREIPTRSGGRGPDILTYVQKSDHGWDYHGFVGSSHDTDSFEFSLTASGDLVIAHHRKSVSPKAILMGVAPIHEESSTAVFKKQPNQTPEPMPLARHGSS